MQSDICIAAADGPAIVFGHADADGHLATIQTRGHLMEKGVSVTTIVSSRTRNYRFWERLSEFDLSGYGLVVFVDIAFRFRHPEESLVRLLKVSDQHIDKRFIIIDHHPLLPPSIPRRNLLLHEVTDPYNCCLGSPDPDLMNVAALCDGAPTAVNPTPELVRRAIGVKRAAADINGIAGNKLLELIRDRQWSFFEALAGEDNEKHQSARGIRRISSQSSPLLEYAMGYSPSAMTT